MRSTSEESERVWGEVCEEGEGRCVEGGVWREVVWRVVCVEGGVWREVVWREVCGGKVCMGEVYGGR